MQGKQNSMQDSLQKKGGPMAGFDSAKVDAEFLAGTSVKSDFLCNLGYGDTARVYPRAPRPDFDHACLIL
jgi:3-hydroxypropanoate dehydrogenase